LLAGRRRKLGDDHPETIDCAFNLAASYRDAGRPKDAVKVIDDWLPRGRARLHRIDGRLGSALHTAQSIYDGAGMYDKEEAVLRDLVDFWKKRAGAGSPEHDVQLSWLGGILLRQRKAAEAEPVLRECLALRQEKQPDSWTTFNMQSMLGESLLIQEKYAEAELQLLAAFEGLKKRQASIPAQARFRLIQSVQRLVRLYNAVDDQKKVAQWRRELEVVRTAGKLQTPEMK
jgi:hypothetical protein